MKREDLRGIEGMTDAMIDAVMTLHGNDVNTWNAQREQAIKNATDPLNSQIKKLNGQVTTLTDQNTGLNAKVQGFEYGEKVSKAGVDSKFAKFVISEVGAMVNDQTDFDTALKGYVKDNPQYLTGIQSKASTGARMNGDNQSKQGNDFMNDLILQATGRK